jgi:hypothetical protein
MSKNKMTAVEWLATEILKLEGIQDVAIPDNLFHIAIQMEREQIEEASFNGVKIGVMNCSYDKIENIIECDYSFAQKECSEYYTQTYE